MIARTAAVVAALVFTGAAGLGVVQLAIGPDHLAREAAKAPTVRILADEAVVKSPFDTSHVVLSARSIDQSADAKKPSQRSFEVGDKITIGSDNGLKRILKVVDVRRADIEYAPASEPGTRGQTTAIYVVSAIDLERPDDKPIRFIVEGEGAEPAKSAAAPAPRTL